VRLIARTLQDLPPGNHLLPLPIPRSGTLGIGLIEGWRGPVLWRSSWTPRRRSGAAIRTILVAELAAA